MLLASRARSSKTIVHSEETGYSATARPLKRTLKCFPVSAGIWTDNTRSIENCMSKHRRGGYLGGSTVIRASVGLLLERTKKKTAKVQQERETLAVAKAEFEQGKSSKLIKSDSPAGQKLFRKYVVEQERARRRAERKALQRSKSQRPGNLLSSR
jgi:Arc/MetJ-type ribon-helix-helix transcriptional regulator